MLLVVSSNVKCALKLKEYLEDRKHSEELNVNVLA